MAIREFSFDSYGVVLNFFTTYPKTQIGIPFGMCIPEKLPVQPSGATPVRLRVSNGDVYDINPADLDGAHAGLTQQQVFDAIRAGLASGSGGGATVTLASVDTLTEVTAVSNDTEVVPAGKHFVRVENTGTVDVTVEVDTGTLTLVHKASVELSYGYPLVSSEITVDATGGNAEITTITPA